MRTRYAVIIEIDDSSVLADSGSVALVFDPDHVGETAAFGDGVTLADIITTSVIEEMS